MAMATSCYSCFPLQRSCLVHTPVTKILRLKQDQFQAKKLSPRVHIKPHPKKKVFEDKSQGIICYRDDDGEIVCEGYDDDETPKCAPLISRTAYRSREADILDLLQQSYVELLNRARNDEDGLTMIKWSELNLF